MMIIKKIKFLNSKSLMIRLRIKINKVMISPFISPLIQPFFTIFLPEIKPPMPIDKRGIIILQMVKTV